MELLLNLLWLAMTLVAFCALVSKRVAGSDPSRLPYRKALLALACVLVVLFPFVSASDDLHPTQAVLEDATKRLQQAIAPSQHAPSVAAILPALLSALLVISLAAQHGWLPVSYEGHTIYRERVPRAGRSPPSF
jgi:uncharacterized BrkB/YihY/UPF0761 family membrane protein